MPKRSRQETRDRVLKWEETIREDSVMYSRLAQHVADQATILDLISHVPAGQLEMNMLLAAVQYLLLIGSGDRLAQWYPSLGGTSSGDGLEQEFERFVATNEEAIHELITTRRVQTNEVARCVFLVPAYNLVEAHAGTQLALVEVGTSAGLNQNVDRYGYSFGSESGRTILNPESPVQLSTDCGARLPDTVARIPSITSRTGVDLHPVDVRDDSQATWLRALVWPDQVERHSRLAAAIELAQVHRPSLVAGDAFDLVPSLVAAAPTGAAVVIQHSFVLNQFPRHDRERLFALLDELAADRPIYRVGAEWITQIRSTVLEVAIHGPAPRVIELGEVHHHGRWIALRAMSGLPF